MRISAFRWTEFHQNRKDPMREIQGFANLGHIYVKRVIKLYTIICNKLWDLYLYFGNIYNRWVLASQQKALGLVNGSDFEQRKHIEIIILAICWRLSAFKSPSHEESIFLKTVTLSSISPNLSKHWKIFSVLTEIVLWEFSIVSSLSWYNILVVHAWNRNDRAWMTSECSPSKIYNFGTVRQPIAWYI